MWSLALSLVLAAHPPAAAPAPSSAPADTLRTGTVNGEALRHYVQGRWLEMSGDEPGAMSEYSRALALEPNSSGLLLRASEAASRARDTERALELAQRAAAREPGSARAQWLVGAALFNLDRAGEALGPLLAASRIDSTNADYLRTLARVGESLDRVPLVADSWRRVVAIEEDDGEAWFQLATAQVRLANFALADSELDRALELNPIRPGAFFLRGLIRENQGRLDEAITFYQRHLTVHAGDQVTRRRLAVLLAHQKRFREGYEQARVAALAQPRDADALQLAADLAYASGQQDAGKQHLGWLLALAPDDPEMALRGTALLVRNERAAEGVRAADAWAVAHPQRPLALEVAARARAIAGQYDSAAVFARRAIASAPDSLGPRRLLARVLQDARHWPEAVAAWREVHDRAPRDLGVLLDLGFCSEQAGDVGGAIDAGRGALKLDPEFPSALNFLGYVLADHERELPEAERLIRRALQQDPDNGAYLDSFGWLMYRLGKFEEARAQLEKAVTLTNGDPTVLEHLGDVYKQLRLIDLARQEYRACLAVDGANARVRGKLEGLR